MSLVKASHLIVVLLVVVGVGAAAVALLPSRALFLRNISAVIPVQEEWNRVIVAGTGLPLSSVEVRWRSDFHGERVVYGAHAMRIANDYGANGVTVYVHGAEVCFLNHFKTNAWHAHDYNIRLTRTAGGVSCIMQAVGPDGTREWQTFRADSEPGTSVVP